MVLQDRRIFQADIQRHEAKYLIPAALAVQVRDFIQPFCEPDHHGHGNPPQYQVTTLHLDTPGLSFHHQAEEDALNRFKLRIRTYGQPGDHPLFAEIKRKLSGCVSKSRAVVPFGVWNEALVKDLRLRYRFPSLDQEIAFIEFRRLVGETGAEPVLLVRYQRESYVAKFDEYARVTFDRRLLYRPTRSWTDFAGPARWHALDTPVAQNKELPYSGVVLELKTLSAAPHWMMDLIMRFDLVRSGHCKYSNAVYQEAHFRGAPALPRLGGADWIG